MANIPMRISDNRRYLQRENGNPFFYLGDTAWELFHRLNREEAQFYLDDRAAKGFTVIQAVALAELGGLTEPNPYGDLPFEDDELTRPNDAYFDHVAFVTKAANDRGLTLGLLPTWGRYWQRHDQGSAKTSFFTPETARAYGRYIAERLQDDDLIWILGGDRDVRDEADKTLLRAMAEGLRDGDGGSHLITFHPRGPGMSSAELHDETWLDFNMVQSSHGARDHDNGAFIAADYRRTPVKPVMDGEPRYESIPVGFYYDTKDCALRFDDYDVRQAAYWALLAGACGHTYGNNNIWQMWSPGKVPVIDADVPWHEALQHPGAAQMGYLRKVFTSRAFEKLAPCDALLSDAQRTGGGRTRAARASDGSFAFIYAPTGAPFTIDYAAFTTGDIRAIWFDPRYGREYPFKTSRAEGFQTYVPPSRGRGCDWLLILERKEN